MSLKVSPLAVEEEALAGELSNETLPLGLLHSNGPKQKTVFSPAFKDEAVTAIRGKITVSF